MRASLAKKTFFDVCSELPRAVKAAATAMIAVLACALGSATVAAQDGFPALPRAAQDQMDSLASRVAAQIRLAKIDPAYTKLFVIDFSDASDKQFSKLGALLADHLSESLASRADGFAVSDRKVLWAYLRDNQMELRDVQGDGVALALARSMEASGVVQGDLQIDPDHQLLLTVRLEGFGSVWSGAALLPLSDSMQALLKEPLPPMSRPSPVPHEPGVLTAGQDGVGVPECIYCPPPLYSESARAARYQGSIQLSVVVTADGRAVSIVVLKGAPFLLNKQALEAVQGWKFKPAEKNGKPVPVRVPVEITLRLN
jgi:TonB family protein